MEGEQFSLCWNNFHSNLSSGFNSLLKDEDLVDVTLAAGGRFLKAHKTVLSVCSPFFKDLFKANPSKHPIVILPEVNYNALCNLLKFMYQGEVSVSQEEIPSFMRVAEMLKVKGLTDNNSSPTPSESNGFGGRSPLNISEQRQMMKRPPRPIKKIIRPIQPLKPIESPKPPQSPHPPPAKRPHVEETSTFNKPEPEPLLKPKLEPIDHSEVSFQTICDENVDLSAMLDAKLGEGSGTDWTVASEVVGKTPDSTPGLSSQILSMCEPLSDFKPGDKYNGNVYLGQGEWISGHLYDSAVFKGTTHSKFVKEMASIVFGNSVLAVSSVTGSACNRTKSLPKPPLNPTKLMAIQDIFIHRLREKGVAEQEIAKANKKVKKIIASKIVDLARGKIRRQPKRQLPQQHPPTIIPTVENVENVEAKEEIIDVDLETYN